jgi:hypothetical protein
MSSPNTVQADFRWRNDDGGETGATWIKAAHVDLDKNPTMDVPIRIRFLLQNTGDKDETDGYRLEYSVDGGSYTEVTTSSSYVRYIGSANTTWTLTDEDPTTQQLGGGTFDEGYWNDQGDTTSFTFAQGQESELEFCIQFRSADITENTIELQVNFDGGSALDGYTYTPSTDFGGTFQQSHFRIRTDDTYGLNVDNGWAADIDTDAEIFVETVFRLRFEVDEIVSVSKSATLKLQFRKNGGSWADLTVQADPWAASANPATFITNSAQYADGDATTNVLSGSAKSFTAGTGEENNSTATVTLNNQHTEIEWALFMRHLYDGPGQNDSADYFEFRIVESDGTLLGGSYVIPRVDCGTPAGLIGGCWVESPNRIGPHADTNGNLYFIHEPADTDPKFLMLKSADGGDTWAEMDGSNRPTTQDLESADASVDGDTLHILHMNSSNDVVYHRFRMSDHPTNPDTWEITDESVAASLAAADQTACIQHRSDGTIVAFYQETSGGNESIRYKIRSYPGETWGSVNDVDTAAEEHTWAEVVEGESGLIHILYKDNTNGYVYHKSLSTGDSLSGRDLVHNDCGVGSSDEKKVVLQPVYWNDGGDEKIMAAVHDESDNYGYSSIITNDGSPAAVVQASDNTIDYGMGGGSLGCPAVLANDGSMVYLLYGGLADGDLWLATYDGGWGVDVKQQTATQIDWVVGTVFTHSPANGGKRVFGYVWDDDSNGMTGKAWYGEYEIPPPIPPLFGVRQNTLLRM